MTARIPLRPPLIFLVLAMALAPPAAASCVDGPAPAARPRSAPEVPVVFVPGITGTKLRDRVTGEVVWGTGALLISPRDGGYAFALPTGTGPDDETRLEAFEVIEEMSLAGVIRQRVYRPIIETLEGEGYRHGDFAAPRPGDTAFLFPYDWRRSNVLSARRLAEGLERLRAARGGNGSRADRLQVDLVCQSNGAHICRYLLRYGGAPLEEAEAGHAVPLPWLEVRKLILVGSSNGGSLRILRELDRGRNYIPLIGRKLQPETTFTFPSVYQDLPVYRSDLFVDAEGRKLDIDLFDAESWRRHGWSVFSRSARRRLLRNPRPDLFGDEAARLAFLARVLDEARRFHRLLARDVGAFEETRYYLLQSAGKDTPERAVLVARDGELRPRFVGDRDVDRNPRLRALAAAPGDGHATVQSQLWLAPREKAAMVRQPTYVESPHFDLVFDPATLRCLAEFLAEPAVLEEVPNP